jgi:hypothetical protein
MAADPFSDYTPRQLLASWLIYALDLGVELTTAMQCGEEGVAGLRREFRRALANVAECLAEATDAGCSSVLGPPGRQQRD